MLFPLEATAGAVIYSKLHVLAAGGNEHLLDFAFLARKEREQLLLVISCFLSLLLPCSTPVRVPCSERSCVGTDGCHFFTLPTLRAPWKLLLM